VGHIAGAYLPADTFVRYHRARGDEVLFVCGSDQYGVPITLMATELGKEPSEVASEYGAAQAAAFEGLNIEFDIYGGTASPLHNQVSQGFFLKCLDKGYLKKKTSTQLYDEKAGYFLPDRYVMGMCPCCHKPGAYGDQCENCGLLLSPSQLIDPVSTISGTVPVTRKTMHWYLNLDAFREPLRQWQAEHEDWRTIVKNSCAKLLSEPLPDRAMTRDLNWGVPVPLPNDPDARGKVLYVWFDAPIGYVSFTMQWCLDLGQGEDGYERWWKSNDCKIIHFIGEDNIIFHGITWPAMLLAEGTYCLPDRIVANAFLNVELPGRETEKISKSRGTAIWIPNYLEEFEPDPLRYYLTMIAPEGQRTRFSPEDYIARVNNELIGAYGNFVQRTISFCNRYLGGRVPARGTTADVDEQQIARLHRAVEDVTDLLEADRFRDAMHAIMEFARASNRYMEVKSPWFQRKEDMVACTTTMSVCLQSVRCLAVLAWPFLPCSSRRVMAMLGMSEADLRWSQAREPLHEGAALGEAVVLFTKLAPEEAMESLPGDTLSFD
jgi:methionyl-tRNA synthetase